MANGGIALSTTGLAGLSVTQVEPLVKWGMSGFPMPAPDPVIGVLAVGLMVAVHIIQKIVSRMIGDTDGDGIPAIHVPPDPVKTPVPVQPGVPNA